VTSSQDWKRRLRRAFTLIELLLVMLVILILMALLLPAINNVMVKMTNARIISEIDQLGMAIENYKNQFGDYPPTCLGNNTTKGVNTVTAIRLRQHFAKAFPHWASPTTQSITIRNGSGTATVSLLNMDAAESFVFFLGGMPVIGPDGTKGVEGWSMIPSDPFRRSNASNADRQRKTPLYEFKSNQFSDIDNDGLWEYSPQGFSNQPYVYFCSGQYAFFVAADSRYYPSHYPPIGHVLANQPVGFASPYGTRTMAATNIDPADSSVFQKSTSFQIIWAGPDKRWSDATTTAHWQSSPFNPFPVFPSGAGYISTLYGAPRHSHDDNLSNFSKGTLGDNKR